VLAANPFGWPDDALTLSALSRRRIQAAANAVQPRLWVHGHMHIAGTRNRVIPHWGHETTVWSLASDGHAGNVRYLDLTTLTELVKPERHGL
jgi:hypothetical protein